MAAVAKPAAATGPEIELPKSTTWKQWLDRDAWRQIMIATPYAWLLIFFVTPFLIVLGISFGISQVGTTPVVWPEEFPWITWANYELLFSKALYFKAYLNSVQMAAIATFFTLLIGYPMALGIARSSGTMRNVLLLLVILPFWTSFLLRIYAWIGLLGNNSWFNKSLTWLVNTFFPIWGDQPLQRIQMMNTDFAVTLGIVYSYLPFMILPLYSTLERFDPTLDEAAMDLGSKRWQVFRDITLPLSIPGIVAGAMLVFIPATGEYVIPALMGRGDSPMIGKVLVDEFFQNRSWPMASAVAVALLFVLVIPIMLYNWIESRSAQGAQK
jgi:putrescine transport system permease protein